MSRSGFLRVLVPLLGSPTSLSLSVVGTGVLFAARDRVLFAGTTVVGVIVVMGAALGVLLLVTLLRMTRGRSDVGVAMAGIPAIEGLLALLLVRVAEAVFFGNGS